MQKLLTLPKKDLEEIAKEDDLEIRCEFCDKVYHFDKNDIAQIMTYVSDKR
jgi:redox-regulated HSP33 family molecular chaperone